MRKELLVYVTTAEPNEEISVTSVSKKRDYVLLTTAFGKITANREELISALKAIEDFDIEYNSEVLPEIPTLDLNEVSYGDE